MSLAAGSVRERESRGEQSATVTRRRRAAKLQCYYLDCKLNDARLRLITPDNVCVSHSTEVASAVTRDPALAGLTSCLNTYSNANVAFKLLIDRNLHHCATIVHSTRE